MRSACLVRTRFILNNFYWDWIGGSHDPQDPPLAIYAPACFSKIQIGFTFLLPAQLGSLGKRAVKRVYVCMYVIMQPLARHVSVIKRKNCRRKVGWLE